MRDTLGKSLKLVSQEGNPINIKLEINTCILTVILKQNKILGMPFLWTVFLIITFLVIRTYFQMCMSKILELKCIDFI